MDYMRFKKLIDGLMRRVESKSIQGLTVLYRDAGGFPYIMMGELEIRIPDALEDELQNIIHKIIRKVG